MAGSLAQSYFIFDSHKYKVGRKIYYTVAEESDDKDEEDDIGQLLGQDEGSSSSSSSDHSIDKTIMSSKMTNLNKSKTIKSTSRTQGNKR